MKAVNLLPSDLRSGARARAVLGPPAPAAPEGGPGAYIVLGALALAVVALVGYVLAANTVKQRQADLAAVSARAQGVQRQLTALKPYADFDSVARARIATVSDLVGQRFRWDRALRDLSRAVPADVTLTALDGTGSSTVGGGGGGASTLRAALDVPAFELQGCTTGQTDVARLMSRLHNVRGVTRVSLSTSDKETVSQRPPVKAGRQDTSVDTGAGACGKGDHPTFDVIAFFGDDTPTGTTAAASGASQAGANLAASAAEASSTPPSSSTTTSDQGAK